MKNLLVAAAFVGSLALAVAPAARAQTTTTSLPAGATPPPLDAARVRRQQQMTPEEAARDQQLQVLEARTGNTSFGAAKGGPERQLDKKGGSFNVRKFRALPGQDQERGKSRRVPMGGHPHGQPLKHAHGRAKRFLFF